MHVHTFSYINIFKTHCTQKKCSWNVSLIDTFLQIQYGAILDWSPFWNDKKKKLHGSSQEISKMYSLFKIDWKVISQKRKCWIDRHFEISVKRNFIHHIISRYFQIIFSYLNWLKTAKSILINNSCILKTKYGHFEISTKISYIISRDFQNVFIYLNRLENAKTIG
jgi:hypothetical protein